MEASLKEGHTANNGRGGAGDCFLALNAMLFPVYQLFSNLSMHKLHLEGLLSADC